jgi:microcystin-dependent protein
MAMATDESCRLGAPMPISGLALTQLIDIGKIYPQRGTGPAINYMAMVHTFAGTTPAFGATTCAGQMIPVAQDQAMFSILGTSYGGDGIRQFGLPNLCQRVAAGGGPQAWLPSAVSMTYMIAASGGAGPSEYPMIGAIGLFGGDFAPAGWLVADGSMLALSQNVPLFEAIGATFGGNGESTFQLPDLQGRAAVGAGLGAAVTIALGQQIDAGPDTPVACLGLNYLINVGGAAPPNGGDGGFPPSAAVLGEVVGYAGATIPDGWLPADGREMSVEANEALFGVIGATFGGDGKSSFALPDLRTRLVEGGLS